MQHRFSSRLTPAHSRPLHPKLNHILAPRLRNAATNVITRIRKRLVAQPPLVLTQVTQELLPHLTTYRFARTPRSNICDFQRGLIRKQTGLLQCRPIRTCRTAFPSLTSFPKTRLSVSPKMLGRMIIVQHLHTARETLARLLPNPSRTVCHDRQIATPIRPTKMRQNPNTLAKRGGVG
jgi:hypothetical protein